MQHRIPLRICATMLMAACLASCSNSEDHYRLPLAEYVNLPPVVGRNDPTTGRIIAVPSVQALGQASKIRVLERSAYMKAFVPHPKRLEPYEPVGDKGIPEFIQVGDSISVPGGDFDLPGATITVNHIYVSTCPRRLLTFGGKNRTLHRYDVECLQKRPRCMAVENEEPPPTQVYPMNNRTWISVFHCEPVEWLERAPSSGAGPTQEQ